MFKGIEEEFLMMRFEELGLCWEGWELEIAIGLGGRIYDFMDDR